jgi:hypothetical protein
VEENMKVLTLSLAALTLASTAAPTLADDYRYDGSYGGYGYQDPCNTTKHRDQNTGAIIGGLLGAVVGSNLAAHHGGRTGGALLGAAAGAAVGANVGREQGKSACQGPYGDYRGGYGYYDRGAYDRGGGYGYGYRSGGDYYRGRNFIRCDRDGYECAVIRCDWGSDCRIVRRFYRDQSDDWRRYGYRFDRGYRDEGGYRMWGDDRGQVRCDPEGDRCWRAG